MAERFMVSVGSGSLRQQGGSWVPVPHRWTSEGVSITGELTGAHVLHLAVACGVLDDVYREAEARSLRVVGVFVTADGGYDPATGESDGVEYSVALDSALPPEVVGELIAEVDRRSAIPQVLRRGVDVRRVGHV